MKNLQQFLGIYFSNKYIRVAVFDPNSQKVSATVEFQRDRDESKKETEEIQSFLDKWGKDKMVILAPPAIDTISLYHEVPFMNNDEVETALKSFMRKGYYYNEDDYSFYYLEMDPQSGNSRKRGYYVVAIPKRYLQKENLREGIENLNIHRLEVAYLAYLRWLLWEKPELKEGTYAAVHFAPDEVLFIIFKDGNPITTRSFYEDILKLDDWKKGNLDNIDDYEVFIRHLAKKIQRFTSNFQSRKFSREITLDKVIFTGMNVGNEYLTNQVSNVLEIPVEGFIDNKARAPVENSNGAMNQRWAVPLGLSMKSMGVVI